MKRKIGTDAFLFFVGMLIFTSGIAAISFIITKNIAGHPVALYHALLATGTMSVGLGFIALSLRK